MDLKKVQKIAADHSVKMVDFKFTDLPGTWHHLTVPLHQLTEENVEEGFGFDGSSLRGWRSINESDMIMKPDLSTAFMDPFCEVPTLSITCDIVLPETLQAYNRDPRQIAKKAVNYLKATGIADEVYFGPEAEFFIFDHIQYDLGSNHSHFSVDSEEGAWNSGTDSFGENLGNKIRHKQGYFPAAPLDTLQDIRTEICLELEKVGIPVERHHHEVASGGQGEINFRFDSLVNSADQVMWFKYIVKNVAKRHGKTATFMPKPIFGDNGSGMHTHMSLWKKGKPLFAGKHYAGLSEDALFFIGGILKHAPKLCAITNPTTNSYKRLVPGFEAPVKLAYSFKNRSAAIRIPNSGPNPKAKRIEFRTPDASANPYLAFAALLMAGIDGIQNKIHPGEPLDKDIYGLPTEELQGIPSVPVDLKAAMGELKSDPQFLLEGEVFSAELLQAWMDYKWDQEISPMLQRPTAQEFYLYYDV